MICWWWGSIALHVVGNDTVLEYLSLHWSSVNKLDKCNALLLCVFCHWTRLSTTLDEVIVYPIPAALYLVKNLLQVGCGSPVFILLELLCHSSSWSLNKIMLIFHFNVAVLHLCICWCPGLSDTEEPEYYQYRCSLQNYT